ncbi:DUF3298 domain-containing protein [Fusobacterium sp. MFO224]|uniref:DUF3298 and DUF4163 domain-containing protein n=1 Tax=Fusobacterium sp. MFO224 TaxID=3378070 RepID=UPI003853602C
MKKIITVFLLVASVGCMGRKKIVIKDIKEKGDNKYYSYEYSVPQLFFKNKDFSKENIKFKQMIEEGKSNLKEEENEIKYLQETLNSSIKYDEKISYQTFKNDFGITSILINNYYYQGGAHGLTETISYNYSNKTGEELGVNDLITEEGREYIENKILKDISEDFKKLDTDKTKVFYFKDSLENEAVALENSNIYFKEDKLIVKYPHYTLAPYSTGMPEFIFSKKELKNYLKDFNKD